MSPVRTFQRRIEMSLSGELPDLVYADDVTFEDIIGPRPALGDSLGLSAVLQRVKAGGIDSVGFGDELISTLAPTYLQSAPRLDDALVRSTLTSIAYSPSGSTDANPGGDAWVNRANPGANFGADSSGLVKANTPVVDDERRVLMEFDLTKFSNLTRRAGGTHRFRFRASHDAAAGSNDLRVRFSTLAARPFTESTVTWNNQPAEGTLQKSVAVAVAEGGTATYTIVFTDAEMAALLGNWVYVRMLSEAALTTTVFTVELREFSSWLLDMELQR